MLLDLIGSLVEVGLHSLDELVEGATVTGVDLKLNAALCQARF